jgi:hypothetical protein
VQCARPIKHLRVNGQFNRKGGMKINGQCIDYFVAVAPE